MMDLDTIPQNTSQNQRPFNLTNQLVSDKHDLLALHVPLHESSLFKSIETSLCQGIHEKELVNALLHEAVPSFFLKRYQDTTSSIEAKMIEHIFIHLKEHLSSTLVMDLVRNGILTSILDHLKADDSREEHIKLLTSTLSLLSIVLVSIPSKNRISIPNEGLPGHILGLMKKIERAEKNVEFFRKAIFCVIRFQLNWEEMASALEWLSDEDEKVSAEIPWLLTTISSDPKYQEKILQHPTLMKSVLEKMDRSSDDVPSLMPFIRVIGDLTSFEDWQLQEMLDLGVLKRLHRLISLRKQPLLVTSACWIFSNLYAGTKPQVLQCVQSPVFDEILALVLDEEIRKSREVWEKISWTALNAIQSSLEHDYYDIAFKPHVIRCLAFILNANTSEPMIDSAISSALYLCQFYQDNFNLSYSLDPTNIYAQFFYSNCATAIQVASQRSHHARALINNFFGPPES